MLKWLPPRARRILNLSVEEQTDLKSKEKDRFVTILRNKFESAGILVTKNSGLIQFGSRGMCFFAMPLPVIVFSNEAPSAQAFTLAHELGHVVLKQSALSGVPGSSARSAKRIEDWCNAFAAAFLVPPKALARFFAKPSSPLAKISDYDLDRLAKAFAISRHAMLIRLINLGYVRASHDWDEMRARSLSICLGRLASASKRTRQTSFLKLKRKRGIGRRISRTSNACA